MRRRRRGGGTEGLSLKGQGKPVEQESEPGHKALRPCGEPTRGAYQEGTEDVVVGPDPLRRSTALRALFHPQELLLRRSTFGLFLN